MRGTLFTIAGILLALWLISNVMHVVMRVLAMGIAAAPIIAIILIVIGLFAGNKNKI